MRILYSHGDSVVWGAELDNKQNERYSHHIAKHFLCVDCNNASAGVSNDYIYRQTMRDVSNWLVNKSVWSEQTNWVMGNELLVVIGWTSPTRFEWWNGNGYEQERLWVGYDKWGMPDINRTTEDTFVLHQTEDIPSYVKTFNHIIGLSSFLEKHNIPYYFYNTFYPYKTLVEPDSKIDKWGNPYNQIGLVPLWKQLPETFKGETMYDYIKGVGGGFLPRNHPTKEAHKEWANFIINKIENEKIRN